MAKAAKAMNLTVAKADGAALAELAKKLPTGRLCATGRGFAAIGQAWLARAGIIAALVTARGIATAGAIKKIFIFDPLSFKLRERGMLKEAPMQIDFGIAQRRRASATGKMLSTELRSQLRSWMRLKATQEANTEDPL